MLIYLPSKRTLYSRSEEENENCQGLKRLVRIIWVYIGIIVRNDGAPKSGEEAIYISVCGLCIARDKNLVLWGEVN
jgi:hypothetical protein